MERDASTWSMSFGPDAEESDFDQLTISLPPGRMLVARIRGVPSPLVSTSPRTSYLCVAGAEAEAVVARTGEGRVLWCEHNESVIHPTLSPDEPLPDDWGGEIQAMVDGHHLIEWISAETYAVADHHLHGDGGNYGRFSARLHPEHRFVTSVAAAKPGLERRPLEMIAHRLIPADETLLAPSDADPDWLSAVVDGVGGGR